ncbi:MAG: PAS domain S-box protein [Desulfosarcina sp.]|nr:PAS domain S-box protein [Desulfosarcina sp.]MBC2742222.1 PAS domain S-box protein [Desulfosarcina sp.]MBC2765134.1 PAS domain S-box protein [Desulfosarcina sp.]
MAGQHIKDTQWADPRLEVELEMQNEDLSKSRDSIEAAKHKYEQLYRKYASLFHLAPIGYLVIDRDGVIHEINLFATISLNAPRSKLIGRCITDFIHRDDQHGFYFQKLNCQKNMETTIFELKIKKADGVFFDAQLQMQAISKKFGEEPEFSVALVDITDHVQLSSSFALQQNCLELVCRATDMEELLGGYVQLVKSYLQCDAVGIRIRDDAGNIPYEAYDGFSQAFYESENPLSLYTDQCMCIDVIKGKRNSDLPYFTPKGSFYINGTSRFLSTASSEELGTTRNVCNAHGYESVALIPVPIHENIRGLIHAADCRENRFPIRVVESLEKAGARLGLALHRFQLQEKLRDLVNALRDLSSHLLTVQEDEQRRIAMELHDQCGQDLNVLKLHLKGIQNRLPDDATDLIQECDKLLTYSDKIIDDIRNIAHGLKPAALDALGLTIAAEQMIREFSTYSKVQVETDIDLLDQIKDPMAQVCLFRIFQEVLTNIHKHAQATWVLVATKREGDIIHIRIEDNGIGFDAHKQSDRTNGSKGMGLSALALRCRMIGAELSIDSEAGKGSRLTICLPCPNKTVSQ